MGFNFNKLDSYLKGTKHTVLPNLQPQQQQKLYNMLAAGTKQPLPPHIPPHLPQFPDPHAYVRTPTHKQPIIDYESVREKAAVQKRDIEKALTKFLAKQVLHTTYLTVMKLTFFLNCLQTIPSAILECFAATGPDF
nr:unnamed protein product [Callosobruchus analis]